MAFQAENRKQGSAGNSKQHAAVREKRGATAYLAGAGWAVGWGWTVVETRKQPGGPSQT